MRPQAPEVCSRPGSIRVWLVPALLLGLVPKCLLCLFAYAGLGAWLGLGGPEICGASGGAGFWTMWLPALGLGAIAVWVFACRRRRRA